MCIVFLSWTPEGSPQGYRLVLAANRDESMRRPSTHARFWESNADILAGVDLDPLKPPNGTWLGVSRRGRFGVLTNYREPQDGLDPTVLGRGQLIPDFLRSAKAPAEHVAELMPSAQRYGGFGILLGCLDPEDASRSQLAYCANREDVAPRTLSAGLYALSNQILDVPWPKLVKGKAALAQLVAQSLPKEELITGLLAILHDRERFPDDMLPKTGIPLESERKLSSVFVDFPENYYGTIAHTVLLVDNDYNVTFIETSRFEDLTRWDTHSYEFSLRHHDSPAV